VRDLEELRGLGRLGVRIDGAGIGRPLDSDPRPAEHQEIEIELPRAPASSPAPTERPLEVLESRHEPEGAGGRIRAGRHVECHDRVPELWLVRVADRIGRIQPGHTTQVRVGEACKRRHSGSQRRLGVTDIRSQADVGSNASVGHGLLVDGD